jgi:hypothetical protein
VIAHIKPLANWKYSRPQSVGPDQLRAGSAPQTSEDVQTLEHLLLSEVAVYNASPSSKAPPSLTSLWQLCCDEVIPIQALNPKP